MIHRALLTAFWVKWFVRMAKQRVYLGIDTSCYTTSVALITADGTLAGEARKILQVKAGSKGLQQSEMVFQHTRNLPVLVKEVCNQDLEIVGIGVSKTPRPLKDSYMPAFLVGLGLARSLAAINGIPLWEISHQENHLEAGLWSAQGPNTDRFLLLHASGGTTDLLLANRNSSGNYNLEQVGGSNDLHAGQFIDRVGVALGLSFPAGPNVEKLALTAQDLIEVPVSVHQGIVSFSGPATAVLRQIDNGVDRASLAAGVQYALAETFVRMIRNMAKEQDVYDVLLVGGVASNQYIRNHVIDKLAKRRIKVWLPDNKFSPDNATGCASYARRQGEKLYE